MIQEKKIKFDSIKKFILRWIGSSKKIYLNILFICTVSFTVIGLKIAEPIIFGEMVSALIYMNDFSNIKQTFLIYIGLSFGILSLNYFKSKLVIHAKYNKSNETKQQIIERFFRIPVINQKSLNPGKYFGILERDSNTIPETLYGSIPSMLTDLVTIVAILIVILMISVDLTIVISIYYMIMIIYQKYASKIIRSKSFEITKFQDRFSKKNKENYDGFSEIKNFKLDKIIIKQTKELLNNGIKSFIEYSNTGLRLSTVNVFFDFTIRIVLLYIGALLILRDKIELKYYLAFSSYVGILRSSIISLSSTYIQVIKDSISFERLEDFFSESHSDDIQKLSVSSDYVDSNSLHLRDVSYTTPEGIVLLKNINLSIPGGSKVAIIGKSGSGKSTLLNIIANNTDVYSGEIYIDGIQYSKLEESQVKEKVLLMGQESFIFDSCILSNICCFDNSVNMETIYNVSERARILDEINQFKDSFNTKLEYANSRLSKGQQKRLAFARALYKQPKYLLLDEPTSGLDKKNEKMIFETIFDLSNEMTVIIATHTLVHIEKYDLIVLIKDGYISAAGTHNNLINYCNEYRDYFTLKQGELYE